MGERFVQWRCTGRCVATFWSLRLLLPCSDSLREPKYSRACMFTSRRRRHYHRGQMSTGVTHDHTECSYEPSQWRRQLLTAACTHLSSILHLQTLQLQHFAWLSLVPISRYLYHSVSCLSFRQPSNSRHRTCTKGQCECALKANADVDFSLQVSYWAHSTATMNIRI